jgi:hypothetical protein
MGLMPPFRLGAIMGFSLRKPVKIAPGVRINLSKSGISTSIGLKGVTYNSRGKLTVRVPGTGLRYTSDLSKRSSRAASTNHIQNERGEPQMAGKREQANDEFLDKIQTRTSQAIQDYFFSHGICVGHYEFARACSLPDHQPVFVPLGPAFTQVNESIKLLNDIGSLSLAAKEKTMRAVYQIEESLREHRGGVEALARALARINLAQDSLPARPTLWPYVVWGPRSCSSRFSPGRVLSSA